MSTPKKKALGRGLSALLKDPSQEVNTATDKDADKVLGQIAAIDIDSIETNPFQPRTKFDKEALEELAASIAELGIVQPITVRKTGLNKFQLISGERRFRASRLAGLTEIPAYVRLADDQAMLEMALVENIQRQDLDAIEVALSYKRLMDECDITQEELGGRVGKKRSTVTNYLRLLKLPPLIQAGIRDEMITMGHARALINVDDEDLQLDMYREIVKNDLSVRQVEDRVRKLREKEKGITPKKKRANEPYQHLEDHLNRFLGTKVELKVNAKGTGKIVIPFDNDSELERIVKTLNG